MNSRLIRITAFTMVLIFLLAMVGCVYAAPTVPGGSKVKMTKGEESFDHSARVYKTVESSGNNFNLKDSGSLHAKSGDGMVAVELDAMKVAVTGKATGTGNAYAKATVEAEGSYNPVSAEVALSSEVSTTVTVTSGKKGTAQATAIANGEATATSGYFEATVDGSSYANGKATASAISTMGGLDSSIISLPDSIYTNAHLDAGTLGNGAAEGSAGASGTASAVADDGTTLALAAAVSGKADTNVKSTGATPGFATSATMASEAAWQPDGARTDTEYARASSVIDSFVAGTTVDKSTLQMAASASTAKYAENTAYVTPYKYDPEEDEFVLDVPYAIATAYGAVSSNAKAQNAGSVRTGAEVSAVSYPDTNFDLPIELGNGGFAIHVNHVGLLDMSDVAVDAAVSGAPNGKFTGSATSTASGAASAVGRLYNTSFLYDRGYSNTSVDAGASINAYVNGAGMAGGQAMVAAINMVNASNGSISLGLGKFQTIDLPTLGVPEIPELPEIPEIPMDEAVSGKDIGINDQIDRLREDIPTEIDIPALEVPTSVEFPHNTLVDVTFVGDAIYADGLTKTSVATASAAAGGTADAFSNKGLPANRGPCTSSSHSEGDTSGSVAANQVADPISVSIVGSISAPNQADDRILDASLIGSAVLADGAKGSKATGSASGSTDSESTTGMFINGPSSADGTVNVAVTVNGGTSVAVAGIGAADYSDFNNPVFDDSFDGTMLDVALVGTAAGSIGTATADAFADGTAHAGFNFPPVSLVYGDADAGGTASTSVNVLNGMGAGVDAVGAFNLITYDWYLSTETEPIYYFNNADITGVSLVGQAVLGDGFAKNSKVKVVASADGEAATDGRFNEFLGYVPGTGSTEFQFAELTSDTMASGAVKGTVDAGCTDPAAASLIVGYNNAEINPVYGADLVPIDYSAYVYDASLLAAVSAAEGPCGKATASADGDADTNTLARINGTVIFQEYGGIDQRLIGETTQDVDLTGHSDASGTLTTQATAKDGLALSAAAQGSSAESEFYRNWVYDDVADVWDYDGYVFDVDHDLTVGLAVATAIGPSANADANIAGGESDADSGMLMYGNDYTFPEIGPYEKVSLLWEDQSTGAFSEGNAGAKAVANGGFAISAAGMASGEFYLQNDPFADLETLEANEFSVMAAIAASTGSTPAQKASALSFADGSSETPNTIADGRVDAATQTIGKGDPIAASMILGLADGEAKDDEREVHAASLLASLTYGDTVRGTAAAKADGFAGARPELYDNLGAYSETEGVITTNSNINNGEGLAIGIAGTMAEAEDEFDDTGYVGSEFDTTSFQISFAASEGDVKLARVENVANLDVTTGGAAGYVFLDEPFAESEISSKSGSSVLALDTARGNAASYEMAGANYDYDLATDISEATAFGVLGTQVTGDALTPVLSKAYVNNAEIEALADDDNYFTNDAVGVFLEDGKSWAILNARTVLQPDFSTDADFNGFQSGGGGFVTTFVYEKDSSVPVFYANSAQWGVATNYLPQPDIPELLVLPGMYPY